MIFSDNNNDIYRLVWVTKGHAREHETKSRNKKFSFDHATCGRKSARSRNVFVVKETKNLIFNGRKWLTAKKTILQSINNPQPHFKYTRNPWFDFAFCTIFGGSMQFRDMQAEHVSFRVFLGEFKKRRKFYSRVKVKLSVFKWNFCLNETKMS